MFYVIAGFVFLNVFVNFLAKRLPLVVRRLWLLVTAVFVVLLLTGRLHF